MLLRISNKLKLNPIETLGDSMHYLSSFCGPQNTKTKINMQKPNTWPKKKIKICYYLQTKM